MRVLTKHERVDWSVPSCISIYEQTLVEGMHFPIPQLAREVLSHYGIAHVYRVSMLMAPHRV